MDPLQEAEREIEAAPTSIKKTFELTNPNEATKLSFFLTTKNQDNIKKLRKLLARNLVF